MLKKRTEERPMFYSSFIPEDPKDTNNFIAMITKIARLHDLKVTNICVKDKSISVECKIEK